MKIHLLINKILVWASIACLSLAYLSAGYWQILFPFLAMAFFWMILKKWSVFWTASSLLLIYIFFAVIGLTMHLPLALLGMGCTFALAGWDLVDFDQSLAGNPLPGSLPFVKNHLRSLAAMVGFSLFLILVSSTLNLQLPFGMVVVLALLAVGCLVYSVRER